MLDHTDKTMPISMQHLFIGTAAKETSIAEQFYKTYNLPPMKSYALLEFFYFSVDDAGSLNFCSAG